MRKVLVMAASAVVGLAIMSACSNSPAGPPTPTPADETATVCAEAIAEGTTAAAEFRAKLAEGVQAVLAGDEAKATQLENELRERLTAWSAKLETLAAKSIKPEVKTALSNAVTALKSLNSEQDQTPVDQVEAKFVELAAALSAACG